MWTTLILLILFAVCFASLFSQGAWNNALTLLNVLMSGLLATNYFEPLARWLDGLQPTLTYTWDFTALWLLFFASFTALRLATDWLSQTAVRLKLPLNMAIGGLLAVWTSWVLVCFTAMTLHAAPLAKHFFRGTWQRTPETRMMFGLAPDQRWLAFAHRVSQGSLSVSPPAGSSDQGEANTFDPRGEFVFKYAQRRENFQQLEQIRAYRELQE